MVASAQLLASNTPIVLVILTTPVINLRLMMYSASLRTHSAHAPLDTQRLTVAYLTADNVYALVLNRFADIPRTRASSNTSSARDFWSGWQGAAAES